jgi:hypothetical protein
MPHNINKDLGMHQVSAKFVLRLLTDDLLQRANGDKNLLKNVINGDEIWVKVMMLKLNNNPPTGSPASPHPKKTH